MSLLILFFALFINPIFQIQAEEITNYHTDIEVNSDGTIKVFETIGYDFGVLDRHGIFRDIDIIKTNSEGTNFKLDLVNFTVTNKTGNPYNFEKSISTEYVKLKIGDADKIITGLHTYIIGYSASGAITYFSDHDELYWNIVGSGWDVPISNVSALIKLPSQINSSEIEVKCFTGVEGSVQQDCEYKVDGSKIYISSDQVFGSGNMLTAVVSFPKGIIAVLEPKKVNLGPTPLLVALIIVIAAIWYLLVPIYIIYRWYKFGRDPRPLMGKAHVWFDVPKTKTLRKLTPAETGTLIDEEADLRDITATIVDLARRGYLKIDEKKKKDFYLEKKVNQKPETNDKLQVFEKKLYDGIFSSKNSVRIKNISLVNTVSEVKKMLYESVVKEGFFDKNPQSTRAKYMVISGFAVFTLNIPLALISFFFGRAMPKKTLFGSQASAIASGLLTFIKSQDKKLEHQAKNQIFFEKFLPYAVAFGVEKIWAERFKDIKMHDPTWYKGHGDHTFTSAYLVNSLNSSFGDISRAITPTSSSSGFSSGFSGGFSGGGGGGGGGGSW
ncbi:DUF2207 domain-containing protein [Patescibacteria group bacterium]